MNIEKKLWWPQNVTNLSKLSKGINFALALNEYNKVSLATSQNAMMKKEEKNHPRNKLTTVANTHTSGRSEV